MIKVLSIAVIAIALTSCTALPIVGGVIVAGTGIYCNYTTENAKEVVRDKVTRGEKVLACD